MYRITYSNSYTKGDRAVVGGIERLRDEAKSLRQKPARQIIARDSGDQRSPDTGETRSRKELGQLFNVSHEAIRIWEENGKLIELGWERIPEATSPVRYRRLKTIALERRGENWSENLVLKGNSSSSPIEAITSAPKFSGEKNYSQLI